MLGNQTEAANPPLNKEVLASRLLAAVAAACLLTVATARALDLGPVQASHPRNWLVAVVCCLLGLRIIAHARHNITGWLVLIMGVCSALAVGTHGWSAGFVPAWLSTWVWWPSYALLPTTILFFPTGRLPSARWWKLVVVTGLGVLLPMIGFGWASWSAPASFWDDVVNGTAARGLPLLVAVTGLACLVIGLVGSLVSLVVRWRRAVSTQRRLLVWSVACTTLLMPALFFEMIGTVWGAWVVFAAAFPVAALIAILWYGLYDINLIIHRSVLYGLLAAILTGAYTITVLAFTRTLPTQAHVIGTIAVVLMLAPLHRRLRRQVDRWLFGDRADPYRALSRLGEQLENPLHPDRVLFEVAHSIGHALKLPYVAIQEASAAQPRLLATFGTSRQWPQFFFPLRQDGNLVGTLVVEARAPEEGFGRREHHLLKDLARQVALAARSARLAEDLRQASYQREEDLQRVTGELHDAVGPSVAAIRLQVDALRRSMDRTDPHTRDKLDQIVDDLTTVSDEVRHLVRHVRPRELQHGLLHAVRSRAKQFEYSDLTVSVASIGTLEQLPTSIEIDAFRIVSEALTNVDRYAKASLCEIVLDRTNDSLDVTVIDNGDGLSPDAVTGTGLDSMRHRCQRRGGAFQIVCLPQGTQVVAHLPFDEPVVNINSA